MTRGMVRAPQPEVVHISTLAEAMKFATVDKDTHMGDPADRQRLGRRSGSRQRWNGDGGVAIWFAQYTSSMQRFDGLTRFLISSELHCAGALPDNAPSMRR